MKLSMHLKIARRNLAASRLRTFLAMLGIMVGTASVVALISGGRLATQGALEQIKGLGTDLMRVNLTSAASLQINRKSIANLPKIDIRTLMAMQTNIPDILHVSPFAISFLSGGYQQQIFENLNIIGASENLAEVIHISMKEGRFISDLDKNQHFCVLGEDIAKKLNSINPYLDHLKLGDQIYTIIGIAHRWAENNILGQDINQAVIIPLPAMLENVPDTNLNAAMLQLNQNADIDFVKQAIIEYFDHYAPAYHVDFQSSKEIINRIENQRTIFTILLGLIGGISLLVGGIGVMNIMLASVAERHSEIGLRIAFGAEPRDVQLMFLMEAVTLAVIGGSLGVIIGILSTVIIANLAHWPFVFLFWPPLIGFSVSLLISMFFGFYPAYVASQLNPIEILTDR